MCKVFLKLRKDLNFLDSNYLQAIEFLRTKRNMSQVDLIDGIMQKSAYSKIKLGHRRLKLSELEKFLVRLNARVQDLEDIFAQQESTSYELLKEFREVLDSPNEIAITDFYKKIKPMRNENVDYLRYTLMIENHFHKHYDQISEPDKELLFDIFRDMLTTDYFTTVDFQFIGDFAIILSSNKYLFLQIVDKLSILDFPELYHAQKTFQYYLPQALTNILDILIDQHNFEKADAFLKVYRSYISYFNDYQYKIMADFYEYRLRYFKSASVIHREQILTEFEEFIKIVNHLFPNMNQIKQITSSFERLKGGKVSTEPLYFFRKF